MREVLAPVRSSYGQVLAVWRARAAQKRRISGGNLRGVIHAAITIIVLGGVPLAFTTTTVDSVAKALVWSCSWYAGVTAGLLWLDSVFWPADAKLIKGLPLSARGYFVSNLAPAVVTGGSVTLLAALPSVLWRLNDGAIGSVLTMFTNSIAAMLCIVAFAGGALLLKFLGDSRILVLSLLAVRTTFLICAVLAYGNAVAGIVAALAQDGDTAAPLLTSIAGVPWMALSSMPVVVLATGAFASIQYVAPNYCAALEDDRYSHRVSLYPSYLSGLPGLTRSTVLLLWTYLKRDSMTLLGFFGGLAMAVCFFVMDAWDAAPPNPYVTWSFTLSPWVFPLTLVSMGTLFEMQVHHSWRAAWIFHVTGVSRWSALVAIRFVFLCTIAPLVVITAGFSAFVFWGEARSAFLECVGVGVVVILMAQVRLMVLPAFPLSVPVDKGPGRRGTFPASLVAISVGGMTMMKFTQGVMHFLPTWYWPMIAILVVTSFVVSSVTRMASATQRFDDWVEY